MTFKIVLTCLYVANCVLHLNNIDRPRGPIGAWTALFACAIDALLIYGIWKWL